MVAEIGIIMGQHNYYDDITHHCLPSLFESLDMDVDFLFIDNGSDDGSFEKFREAWPDLDYVRNENNESLAVFMNNAVKQMRNPWVSLTCNDFLWKEDIYRPLLEAADEYPQVKLWSPRLFHMEEFRGETYCFIKERFHLQIVDNRAEKIHICSGLEYVSPLLVHRDTFNKLGGYDENLIYGYEETDYILRLYQEGYSDSVGSRSDVTLYHYGTGFTRKRVWGSKFPDLCERNRFYMKGKWGDYATSILGPGSMDEWEQ